MNKKLAANIKIPILFLLADDDKLVKTEVTLKFAKLNPNIRIEHISNSKHTIYTSSPEAIADLYKTIFKYFG